MFSILKLFSLLNDWKKSGDIIMQTLINNSLTLIIKLDMELCSKEERANFIIYIYMT